MILYKTGGYNKLIEEVEVIRANEKSYWTLGYRDKEQRSARHSNYTQYWDTIEDAKTFLRERFERSIKATETKLSKLKSDLNELKNY